jgi:DUF4097 and DUF4098 domain-containing protein YvlB
MYEQVRMRHEGWIYTAAAVICAGWLLAPTHSHAAKNRNFNINTSGNASSCADLRVTSSGELAQVNQSFALSKGEAPILEMNAADRGQIHVRAWDHADYSIETCKIAVADTRSAAEQIASAITVNHTAGNLSFSGPTTDSGDWTVVFFVHAPKDAVLNLETKNGPIDVDGVNGSVKLRATNGPIAVHDCGGSVEVHTKNGPIAFHGDRGEVHLIADNGPIALHLAAQSWNGSLLEARTINGPLAVHLPDNFRSGMRLETSGHTPISCQAELCRNAWTDASRGNRTFQMNGSGDTVRLSTENGPVAIHAGNDQGKQKF